MIMATFEERQKRGIKNFMEAKRSLMDDVDRIFFVLKEENGGKSPTSIEVAKRLNDEIKERERNDHDRARQT